MVKLKRKKWKKICEIFFGRIDRPILDSSILVSRGWWLYTGLTLFRNKAVRISFFSAHHLLLLLLLLLLLSSLLMLLFCETSCHRDVNVNTNFLQRHRHEFFIDEDRLSAMTCKIFTKLQHNPFSKLKSHQR